jgi:hypothetical protein
MAVLSTYAVLVQFQAILLVPRAPRAARRACGNVRVVSTQYANPHDVDCIVKYNADEISQEIKCTLIVLADNAQQIIRADAIRAYWMGQVGLSARSSLFPCVYAIDD